MTEPEQTWWSAAELADAALPDLPGTKRKINELAKREGWGLQNGKARRRRAVGGGIEYHWSLLPLRARTSLVRQAKPTEDAAQPKAKLSRDEAWAAYETVSDSAKAKAKVRFAALEQVEALVCAGLTRYQATEEVARDIQTSSRSIWNWHECVEGVPFEDWLPYLVPRHQLAKRAARSEPVDPEFFALIKRWYLSPEQRAMTSCYRWAVRVAEKEDLPIAPLHQVRRHYKATVSKPVEIFWRKGADALKRFYPAQTRDKTAMVPLECVQGDYHKFDVFVQWPGEDKPVRVQAVFFSDVYSGKVLAWRYSLTANSHTVQLCLGDLIETYGIPQACVLDNGREFAAKVITGGTPTRNRFKITDEDIPGLLPLMGTDVLWANPYSGQSKPIERTFRDFCQDIAKHPAFEGAYTGNSPTNQPDNYGSRAIPFADFQRIVDQEIGYWNARPDRRTEVAMGRSFNEVFNTAYKTAQPRKATEQQLRLWLLRAEGVRANSKNGEISLFGSRFWCEWAYKVAGQKVVARFDPDDLHAGVEVYDLSGSYLGHSACLVAGQFRNVEDAQTHNRKRKSYEQAIKAEAKALRDLDGAAAVARLRAAGKDVTPDTLPHADVVKMPTPHKAAPKPMRRVLAPIEDAEQEAAIQAQITRLEERRMARADQRTPEEIFDRAMELEAIERDGTPLTPDQAAWLKEYQQSAEYRARVRMARAFGNRD